MLACCVVITANPQILHAQKRWIDYFTGESAWRELVAAERSCAANAPDSVLLVGLIGNSELYKFSRRGQRVYPPLEWDTLRVAVPRIKCGTTTYSGKPVLEEMLLERDGSLLSYQPLREPERKLDFIRFLDGSYVYWSFGGFIAESEYSDSVNARAARLDAEFRAREAIRAAKEKAAWTKLVTELRNGGWTDSQIEALRQNRIIIGMTRAMVEIIWGAPFSAVEETTSSGAVEAWVYLDGRSVTFTKGKVSKIGRVVR